MVSNFNTPPPQYSALFVANHKLMSDVLRHWSPTLTFTIMQNLHKNYHYNLAVVMHLWMSTPELKSVFSKKKKKF